MPPLESPFEFDMWRRSTEFGKIQNDSHPPYKIPKNTSHTAHRIEYTASAASASAQHPPRWGIYAAQHSTYPLRIRIAPYYIHLLFSVFFFLSALFGVGIFSHYSWPSVAAAIAAAAAADACGAIDIVRVFCVVCVPNIIIKDLDCVWIAKVCARTGPSVWMELDSVFQLFTLRARQRFILLVSSLCLIHWLIS